MALPVTPCERPLQRSASFSAVSAASGPTAGLVPLSTPLPELLLANSQSPSFVACSVCGRAIARPLACVDADSKEVLCPIHFRQRHFKRVFEQRKQERWTPTPKPPARLQSAADSETTTNVGSAASPDAATSSTNGGCAEENNPPLKSTRNAAAPSSPPSAQGPLSAVEMRAIPQCSAGAVEASMETEAEEAALTPRAMERCTQMGLRRGWRALRSWRSHRWLAARADGLRVGRSFAALLASALCRALRYAESIQMHAAAARRRAFRRICAHTEGTLWHSVSADTWRERRHRAAALVVMRWFASLRRGYSERLEAGTRRHEVRARALALSQWSILARRTSLHAVELTIAAKFHRRHALLTVLAHRLAAHAARRSARARLIDGLCFARGLRRMRVGMRAWSACYCSTRDRHRPSIDSHPGHSPPAGESPAAGAAALLVCRGSDGGNDHAAAMARRVAVAERRAAAALMRVADLEATLAAERQDAHDAQQSFRREREALLETIGALFEREAGRAGAVPARRRVLAVDGAPPRAARAVATRDDADAARSHRLVRTPAAPPRPAAAPVEAPSTPPLPAPTSLQARRRRVVSVQVVQP